MSQKTDILRGIWDRTFNLYNLPNVLYKQTSDELLKGVRRGFGSSLKQMGINNPDYDLMKHFENNIYKFSANKTFQTVKELEKSILDKDGFIRSFDDFYKETTKTYDVINKAWLETEFNTAISQANTARQWGEIQEEKETFPYLQYITVGDGRVRDSHAALDGIVKPVDSDFWDENLPRNDWNCRCEVLQLEENKPLNNTDYSKIIINLRKNINPLFAFNPAKKKIIFSEKHPYFRVPRKFKELQKKNFNLKIPDEAKL